MHSSECIPWLFCRYQKVLFIWHIIWNIFFWFYLQCIVVKYTIKIPFYNQLFLCDILIQTVNIFLISIWYEKSSIPIKHIILCKARRKHKESWYYISAGRTLKKKVFVHKLWSCATMQQRRGSLMGIFICTREAKVI